MLGKSATPSSPAPPNPLRCAIALRFCSGDFAKLVILQGGTNRMHLGKSPGLPYPSSQLKRNDTRTVGSIRPFGIPKRVRTSTPGRSWLLPRPSVQSRSSMTALDMRGMTHSCPITNVDMASDVRLERPRHRRIGQCAPVRPLGIFCNLVSCCCTTPRLSNCLPSPPLSFAACPANPLWGISAQPMGIRRWRKLRAVSTPSVRMWYALWTG